MTVTLGRNGCLAYVGRTSSFVQKRLGGGGPRSKNMLLRSFGWHFQTSLVAKSHKSPLANAGESRSQEVGHEKWRRAYNLRGKLVTLRRGCLGQRGAPVSRFQPGHHGHPTLLAPALGAGTASLTAPRNAAGCRPLLLGTVLPGSASQGGIYLRLGFQQFPLPRGHDQLPQIPQTTKE